VVKTQDSQQRGVAGSNTVWLQATIAITLTRNRIQVAKWGTPQKKLISRHLAIQTHLLIDCYYMFKF